MRGEDWHAWQDEQATEIAIDRAAAVMGRPDAVFRIYYWAGYEFFVDAHIRHVVALHSAAEPLRILDVGCGKGDTAGRLAQLLPRAEVIGLDANEASIEHARRAWPDVEFVQDRFEGATDLGRFDIVICSEVYEHVESPDALLATIWAVLRPGGHLSLSTPSGWMWRRPGPLNAYRLARQPGTYRLLLRPERDWRRALPLHPASRPAAIRDHLRRIGFDVVERTSSIWYLEHERYSIFYRSLARLARGRPLLASRMFFYGWMLGEALMNLVPPLRFFESRLMFVAQRPKR